MKKRTPIEEYLETATEGLRGDAELRRDVQAELAGHLEDARAALLEKGHSEDDAARESLKGMGDVLDTAASLQNANLGRIKVRGLARIGLQYVLAPVAVVVALLVARHLSDLQDPLQIPRMVHELQAGGGLSNFDHLDVPGDPSPADDAYLILHGDSSRGDGADRHRTLWERHPADAVYLGHYVSALAAEASGDDTNRVVRAIGELEAASGHEPDNARFDVLRAALMVQLVGDLEEIPEAERDGPLSERLVVNDADAFVEAMDTALAGLEKPYLKRYSRDMLLRQHEVLGPSRRFGDWIRQTSVSASVLLPDLQHYRTLTRMMVQHGRMLLENGKPDEARRFLDAWEPLVRRYTDDAFTLIDALVIGAIMASAETDVAGVYDQAGLAEDARRTRERAGRLRRGVEAWRASVKARTPERQAGEGTLLQRGGVMSHLLMPALGVWPDEEDYEASRRLEYTVAAEQVVVAASFILVAMLIGCALVALRWRLGLASAGAIPILLVPRFRQMAGVVVWGVLVPLGVFLLVTRYVPWSGHAFSVKVAGHKLIAEFGLLVAAWILIPAWMTARSVRERCLALAVPVVPLMLRYVRWPAIGAGLGLAVMWLVPATAGDAPILLAALLGGALLLAAGIAAILALVQGFGGKTEHGLYYGTLFRSMIPNLALAVMLLGLVSSPILVRSEATYLAADSLMADSSGGFTLVETELTARLLNDIRAGFEELD